MGGVSCRRKFHFFFIMIKIYLKPGKEMPILRFHPWVFSGAVARIDGRPDDGDIAEVYELAFGFADDFLGDYEHVTFLQGNAA